MTICYREDEDDIEMSSSLYWPPTSPEELKIRADEASKRELSWLLNTIFPQPLQSTQDGLTECIALLDPQEGGSTLALSSSRSETLKGFVVRMGERIVKGELLIKLSGLGSSKRGYPVSIANKGIVLEQVIDARNHIAAALVMFDTPLTETNVLHVLTHAPLSNVQNLTTLLAHISAARTSLRMAPSSLQFPCHVPSSESFETPLPSSASLDLTINEGLLQLDIRVLRTITPKSSPVPSRIQSHTSLITLAIDSATKLNLFKKPEGIGGETYKYDGKEVIVIEQVRVSSADPNFIAVLAKLAVLEERVNSLRGKAEIVALHVQKTY